MMQKFFALLLLFPLLSFAQTDLSSVVETLSRPQASLTPKVDCDERIIPTSITENDSRIELSSVSDEYAKVLFEILKGHKEIPFLYPQDGCYARAHAMALILEKLGVITGKIYIEGKLQIESNRSPNGIVDWVYHVAPIVMVREGDKEVLKVFDPSMFDHPVTVDEWENAQTSRPGTHKDRDFKTNRYAYWPDDQRSNPNSRTKFLNGDVENMKQTMEDYLIYQRWYDTNILNKPAEN